MLKRFVLFLVLSVFFSSLANAQSVKLTSNQISKILTGNTDTDFVTISIIEITVMPSVIYVIYL